MKLEFKIQKPLEEVFQYLADADKFVEVHPVITGMTRNSDDSYKVYEIVRLAFIPIRFTYRAFIEPLPSESIVYMKAVVGKFTTIHISFSLTSNGSLTFIEDRIDITAPRFIKGIAQHILKTQHEKLFDNIKRVS